MNKEKIKIIINLETENEDVTEFNYSVEPAINLDRFVGILEIVKTKAIKELEEVPRYIG